MFQNKLISLFHITPFGSAINTRSYSSGAYRYGFNGKEKDSESFNDAYDFGARIYDGRLGRLMCIDPFASEFPYISSYITSKNNPIFYIDKSGLFALSSEISKNYPLLTNYINNYLKNDVIKSPTLKAQMMKLGQFKDEAQLLESLTKDEGPNVGQNMDLVFAAGGMVVTNATNDPLSITLHGKLLEQAEKILKDPKSTDQEKQAAILTVSSTLLHENVHFYDKLADRKDQPDRIIPGTTDTEDIGAHFERKVWGNDVGSSRNNLPEEDKDVPEKVFPEYQKDAINVVKEKSSTEDGNKTLPTIPAK